MKRFISVVFLLAAVFNLSACTGNTEEIEWGDKKEIPDDRAERIACYARFDGGFYDMPEERPAFSYMTYYARKYFDLTGRKDRNRELSLRNENVQYIPSLEEQIKANDDIWGLWLDISCTYESVKEDRELLKAVSENTRLNEILKFEEGGPFGNFADFYYAIEICELLNLEYDGDKAGQAMMSDISQRVYENPSSKYSDLYMAYIMNKGYGVQANAEDLMAEGFAEYDREIRKYAEEGTLPIFMLNEYAVTGKAVSADMMKDSEILTLLEGYRDSMGAYGYLPCGENDISGNAMAVVTALELTRLCGGEFDTAGPDVFFTSCERSDGTYALPVVWEESEPDMTFFAMGCLNRLGSLDEETVKKYIDGNRQLSGDIFYDNIAARAGIQVEIDVSAAAEDISNGIRAEERLFRAHLFLDTCRIMKAELSEEEKKSILDAAGEYEDFDEKYLSVFLEKRVTGSEEEYEGMKSEVLERISEMPLASCQDIFYIMYICENDETAAAALSGQKFETALERFLNHNRNSFGFYPGVRDYIATLGGIMAEQYIER